MSIDEQVMSPYYEIDLSVVRENLRAFMDVGFVVAYSVKANKDAEIIKEIASLGGFFEASSSWEYDYLKQIGVSASHIIVNLCYGSKDAVSAMIEDGVLVVADSLEILEAIAELHTTVKIGLRVNLDRIKVGDEYWNRESRFGLDVADAAVRNLLQNNTQINVVCLHCHFSGNSRSPKIYASIARELSDMARAFSNVRLIDVGGGFKTHVWKPMEYRDSILASMKGASLDLIVEPGNAIVRTAGSYIVHVVAIRVCGDVRVVRTSGSYLHVGRRKVLQNDIVACVSGRAKVMRQIIVGCSCKESDVLGELERGDELRIGDMIKFRNVGAYCMDEFGRFLIAPPQRKYVCANAGGL